MSDASVEIPGPPTPRGEPTVLEVDSLYKRFGKKQVVRDVSFSMHEGEVVGFLGPNGAGKTTVFYMIVGFISPTAGRIFLGGRNITGKAMYKRARAGISYLPQEASVFRKLTVEKNVWAILETRRDLTRKERKASPLGRAPRRARYKRKPQAESLHPLRRRASAN